MLLRKLELQEIKAGTRTLVFRRWKRPTVRSGGALKTSVGVLDIVSVKQVDIGKITAREALLAGYAGKRELLESLNSREGDVYRIEVRYAGADPRIALREDDQPDADALAELRRKLEGLDNRSRVGPWTLKVLHLIRDNPHVAAARLAEVSGLEKEWLKLNIRKLKNLGLTISHEPGYELSPRGRAWLSTLRKKGPKESGSNQ